MFKPESHLYDEALIHSTMENQFLQAVLLKEISVHTDEDTLWRTLDLPDSIIVRRWIIEPQVERGTKDAILFFVSTRHARLARYVLNGLMVDGCCIFATYLGNSIMKMLHLEENAIQLFNITVNKYKRDHHTLKVVILALPGREITFLTVRRLLKKFKMFGQFLVIDEDEDATQGSYELTIAYDFFTEAYAAYLYFKDRLFCRCYVRMTMTRDPEELRQYLGLNFLG